MTCFIPRSRTSYKNLNYAFLSFESDEIALEAFNKIYKIKGNRLYWTAPHLQHCYICGDPSHKSQQCTNKKGPNKVKSQYDQLYNKYKPAQYRTRAPPHHVIKLSDTKTTILTTMLVRTRKIETINNASIKINNKANLTQIQSVNEIPEIILCTNRILLKTTTATPIILRIVLLNNTIMINVNPNKPIPHKTMKKDSVVSSTF